MWFLSSGDPGHAQLQAADPEALVAPGVEVIEKRDATGDLGESVGFLGVGGLLKGRQRRWMKASPVIPAWGWRMLAS